MDINKELHNEKIDISFCVPIYNVKPYLERLLNSIFSQDLNSISYEFVFVDDCSTDDSLEHLEKLTAEIPNVRIIKNEKNSGISYTRNKLIDEAKGDYIWFIDSDDMIYPDTVKLLLNEAKKHNADIVIANYIKVDEDADVENAEKITDFESKQADLTNWDWLPDKDNGSKMFVVWRGIFKRVFLINNNLYFNKDVIMKEDALLYYEFVMKNPCVIKCEFPCYYVRQRATSAMNGLNETKARKYYLSSCALIKRYEEHILNGNCRDIEEMKALIETEKKQITKCLLKITDKKYVREQLDELQKKGLYPYKIKKPTSFNVYQIMDYLATKNSFFWLVYSLNRLKEKIGK